MEGGPDPWVSVPAWKNRKKLLAVGLGSLSQLESELVDGSSLSSFPSESFKQKWINL